jgi:hypothetical protein
VDLTTLPDWPWAATPDTVKTRIVAMNQVVFLSISPTLQCIGSVS